MAWKPPSTWTISPVVDGNQSDINAQCELLLDAASVPATIVNWGGDEKVSVEEWCAYLSELTGVELKCVASDNSLASVVLDLSKMHELVGHTTVKWRDGFRRMIETQRPDLLKS